MELSRKWSFRPGIWDGEPALVDQPAVAPLWEGYLAAGKVTLLTSLWKSGKTTLLTLLLARRAAGGTLVGRAVLPGNTVVISEEAEDLWAERRRRLDFGGRVCLMCQPFDGRPTLPQWLELMDYLCELRRDRGVDLVVVDTLSSFLPGRNENNATVVQDALLPFRRLTRQGVATLLMHHPRKGEPRLGQAARGSGAFDGFADICIEMAHPGGDPFTRRRLLRALSRLKETPQRLLMELNAEATDYTVCEGDGDDFGANWNILLMVLEEAHKPLTRREMLEEWPADFAKPSEPTLWKWTNRAVELGLLKVEGTGARNNPFRYWLAANEEKWQADPVYQMYRNQRWLDEVILRGKSDLPPPPPMSASLGQRMKP
jgi:hypothetical protein